jgi:hypothetical protein
LEFCWSIDPQYQVSCLYIVAENAVRHAVQQGRPLEVATVQRARWQLTELAKLVV